MGRREEIRKALNERTKESQERKDDSGRFRSFFKSDVGDEIQFFRPEKGPHAIDIIPYRAGAYDPHVKEGEWSYVLDLWVHMRVGVNEDQYICLARNYDQPCPICEYQKKLMKEEDYDEDLVLSLNPKRRTVYNIICYDNDKEEDKGVQVWEVAHFFMEKKLVPLAKDRKTGEPIPFSDPWDGMVVSWEMQKSSFKDRSGNVQSSWEYLAHRFEPRDYDLEDELDNAFCLDELIHVPTYDEITSAFFGGTVNEEGKKVEEEPEETDSRRGSRGKEKEEETVEVQATATECPNGYRFGQDINQEDECNECKVWDDCAKKADEIREEKEKANPPRRRRRK